MEPDRAEPGGEAVSDLFDARAVTLRAQLDAAKREVRLRDRVYPRLVETGKMTRTKARDEADAMRAIVSTLEALLSKEGRP